MTSIYNTCTNTHGDNITLVVQCVAQWVETVTSQAVNATTTTQAAEPVMPIGKYVEVAELNRWLLVFAGAMVFFMQVCNTTSNACHMNLQKFVGVCQCKRSVMDASSDGRFSPLICSARWTGRVRHGLCRCDSKEECKQYGTLVFGDHGQGCFRQPCKQSHPRSIHQGSLLASPFGT
jgi:hypothetical protein